LENAAHRLQLTDVFPSHPVTPAGLEGRALTCNHREQCTSIVPEEEQFFPLPDRRVGYREVEVQVDPLPSADIDVSIAPHRRFYI
jgi:hypothetical protein